MGCGGIRGQRGRGTVKLWGIKFSELLLLKSSSMMKILNVEKLQCLIPGFGEGE